MAVGWDYLFLMVIPLPEKINLIKPYQTLSNIIKHDQDHESATVPRWFTRLAQWPCSVWNCPFGTGSWWRMVQAGVANSGSQKKSARFLLQSAACIEGGSCYDSNVVGFGVPWKNPITQSLVLHRTGRELVTEVVAVSFAIQHWCHSPRGNHRTHLWHICDTFVSIRILSS